MNRVYLGHGVQHSLQYTTGTSAGECTHNHVLLECIPPNCRVLVTCLSRTINISCRFLSKAIPSLLPGQEAGSEERASNHVQILPKLKGGSRYAQLFASRGANVVVNDVSKEAADKVVATITEGIYPLRMFSLGHSHHVFQLEARLLRTLRLSPMERQSFKRPLMHSVVSAFS